jgi:transposase
MITLGNRRLWLCGEPVDMRKGIDGLIAVVQQRLLREAMTGDVFLFVGRDPSRLKILCWDRDGYWLATKRLSQGRFQVPRAAGSNGLASAIELTATEWQLILDGILVRDRTVLVRHGR